MKKLLIGLFILGNFSSFAGEICIMRAYTSKKYQQSRGSLKCGNKAIEEFTYEGTLDLAPKLTEITNKGYQIISCTEFDDYTTRITCILKSK